MILKFLKETKRLGIKKSDNILLAISGGGDSIAMAILSKNLPNRKAIAYIDHKLRKESKEEKQFVADLAKKLKMPFFSRSFDVVKFAKKNKMSIEDAARECRYRKLAEISRRHNFGKILTAHTLTDNIETIFVKILRGGGINSFYGISERTKLFGRKIVRALLWITRQDLRKFLKSSDFAYLTDKSNYNPKFLRNRIRGKIIPVFRKNFGNFEKRFREISRQAKELREFLETEKKKISKSRRQLDINRYLSYNKFVRKSFLAEFLEGKANSETVEKIDRFLRQGKTGSFSLRGFDFVIREKTGAKKGK